MAYDKFQKKLQNFKYLIDKRKGAITAYINPVSYATDIMTDETFIDMFLGYANLEKGNLRDTQYFQEKLIEQMDTFHQV